MSEEITDESLSNRVVLLGVASLAAGGETPAHAPTVRRACTDHEDVLSDAVVGTLDEATVARSLNELESHGYVARVETGESSPVGKGRPEFALDEDVDVVLDALDDDDQVADAVDVVRDER